MMSPRLLTVLASLSDGFSYTEYGVRQPLTVPVGPCPPPPPRA
jgi:hypothetical protein